MLSDRCDVKLVYGSALLLRLLAPVSGHVAKQRGARMVRRDFRGRMREEQILGETALMFGDGSEALDFFGVDDGQVETGFGAVIEKNRIHDFARARGKAEGNVGNAENSARIW